MKRFALFLFSSLFLAGLLSACIATPPSGQPISIKNTANVDPALFGINPKEPEAEKQGEAIKAAREMAKALQEINRQEQYEELLETTRSVVELDILEDQIQR